MKKLVLLFLFLSFCILGYSQNTTSFYPNFIGQKLDKIENNEDWKVLQKSTGDLNRDGLNDFALILESKDSILEKRCANCKLLKTKPRIILILLNQNDSDKVIIQNNQFIARGDDGGMLTYLEPELFIENGLMTIYYQFTRFNQSYTFELIDDKMKIIIAESYGVHSASGNFVNDTYDFKKGELISETGNISQEEVKTEILKFNTEPKILSEFGEMFDW